MAGGDAKDGRATDPSDGRACRFFMTSGLPEGAASSVEGRANAASSVEGRGFGVFCAEGSTLDGVAAAAP